MNESAWPLSPAAIAFYSTLSGPDYPRLLVDQYPRIANRIVELQSDDAALKCYFESLITDMRGNRRGFPFPILGEIQHLFALLVGIPDNFAGTMELFLDQPQKP